MGTNTAPGGQTQIDMTNRISADHVLEVLQKDTTASDFYSTFYDHLKRRGCAFPEDEDLVKFVSGLSIDLVSREFYGGVRNDLCGDRGISLDKAYRLCAYVRQNHVFREVTSSVFSGKGYEIRVYEEPEIYFTFHEEVQTDDANVVLDQNGNEGYVTSFGTRITSLEELIEHSRIDLEQWEITGHKVNKYETAAKVDRIVGYDDNKKPITVTEMMVQELFQVEARMRRLKLRPQAFPPLQPVSIGMSILPKPKKVESTLRSALVIPDPQIGFRRDFRTNTLDPLHDRRALDLVLQERTYALQEPPWSAPSHAWAGGHL